jgi:plasmid stabilization system protein ParE
LEKENLEIHFLPRAFDDIDEILTFMYEEKYTGIEQFFNKMQNSIEKLSSYPRLGHIPENIKIAELNYRVLRFKLYSVFCIIPEISKDY